MNILFLGFSDILQRKILPSIENLKEIKYEIASKSKIKNKSIKINYSSYYKAINYSNSKTVYISLINSLHFKLCKYALNKNKHVIVDKPLALNTKDSSYLINLAKSKKLLLIEGTVFHLSKRFKDFFKLINFDKNTVINANFSIPKLDIKNFRNNPRLGGGCYNDMSSYAIKCIDIFLPNKYEFLYFKSKNKKKLNTGFSFVAESRNIKLKCNFEFNSKYKNNIEIQNERNKLILPMAFSQQLYQNQYYRFNKKKIIYKKDNTFSNLFMMISKVLKRKKYDNYYQELEKLNSIRRKLEKKF